MLKIYHNTRCAKSRAGLEYLQKKGHSPQVIQYLKSPFTETELEAILLKLDMEPEELVRTQEPLYKQKIKGKSFTEKQWIKIFIQNPQLIKRPIVVTQYKAILADPPELVDQILD